MFNKDTKSTYAGAMKVLAVLLAFSVVSIAAMRLYTPASSEATTESVVADNTIAVADITDAAMAPLACFNSSSYGSGAAPTAGCVEVVLSTCNFASEYATVTGAIAGTEYTFFSSIATDYLTVTQGSPTGTVIGEGTQPVAAVPTANSTIYVHINTNSSCGTQSTCRATSIICSSCAGPSDYCAVTSTNTSYGISNVTTTGGVANINNTSGSGQYTFYSNQFVSANPGDQVTISVAPVFSSSHGYRVWVDWNDNKCFEGTPAELVGNSIGYITGTFSSTITVPAGTPAGDYRMRVVNNYLSGTPTACGTLGSQAYGEAEDYVFRVLGQTGGGGPVPCDIDYKFSLDNGTGNVQTLLFADDFDVPASTDMTIDQVTFRLIADISMATNIRFYADNAGNPGTLIQGFTNLVPAAKNVIGTNFGFNFYDMVFNLPTSVTLSTGRYWVAIQTTGGQGLNYWAITYNGIGAPGKYSTDNGVSWVQNSSAFNFGFRLDGDCVDPNANAGGGIECLLVCSNDQTITLAPGTCEANVNYLVTTVGPKCDGAVYQPIAPFSQLTTFPVPIDDALDCNIAVAKHSRAYPARTEAFNLTGIDVGSWTPGQQRINVFAYTGPLGGGTLDRNQMTLIYQTPYFPVPGSQQVTHYDFPAPAVIPAGTAFVVEQEKGVGNGNFVIASTYSGQSAPSYMTCNQGDTPVNYANFGYASIRLYQVLYGAIEKPGITIEQTSGIPSGEIFPVGTTTNCFRLINKDGVAIDSCCFDITINKYPKPTKTLVCNDYLYISADENCEVSLNADMFLEGGPYGCYDDYTIMIWPFGYEQNKYAIEQNKPLYIPLGEHMYEIIDPSTGNRCWGSFKVEDKLAPVAECSCEDKDILEPVTSWAGLIQETDPDFDRCNFTAGQNPMHYTVSPKFQVSVDGSYTFQVNTNWTTAYYIYEANLFDPANPCNNVIAQLQITFIPIPPMNATLTAGKDYIIVATQMWGNPVYNGVYPLDFSIGFSGPGDVLFVQNASDAPECQFKCYDLETVEAETVSMLYKYPGEQNKAVLTIPPAVTDGCG
ncbi:MAG: GEVED domain-containing protein, partial [Chitinophagales bacterium]|nr:GEVED domain-containing protein [Chitinophagales bacterium]